MNQLRLSLVSALLLLSSPVLAQDLAPADLAGIFEPLPAVAVSASNPATPAKVKLGKKLFFETKLSKSGAISCNSCHGLTTFGVDNRPTSPGHEGQLGGRNSPTVYNAALHIAQFWDGRANDVEAQALGPIMNPVEMAMGAETDVIATLSASPQYVKLFKKAFPQETQPITFANVGKAIGAFERTLLTPSRFDPFLKGKTDVSSRLI